MSAEHRCPEAVLRAAVKAAASATLTALQGTRAAVGGGLAIGGVLHAAEAAAALELRALISDPQLRATVAAALARQAGAVAATVVNRDRQRRAAARKAMMG